MAGGLGLEFFATAATLSDLTVGETATVHTCLVLREDSLSLYGFTDASQRETFATLMQVKGIGPKLGLAALGLLSPAELAAAVAARDLATLQRIPGVGKKSAERMVIDIGDKLGITQTGTAAATAPANTVIAALTNLGWNQAQAAQAVAAVEPGDTATVLREALQYLGGQS